MPDAIEVAVVPREGSQARCSGWGRAGPTYDHAARPRVWIMPPVFKFALALIYTMRRVDCPVCGVVVEKVPWATGKEGLCEGFRLFLAHWARKLSWEEVALSFKVSWTDVYASVQWGGDDGLKHRGLENIQAIGVDESCVRVGRVFWTLIYQIDDPLTRLLWVGHHRTEQTLLEGLNRLGEAVCAGSAGAVDRHGASRPRGFRSLATDAPTTSGLDEAGPRPTRVRSGGCWL